MLRRRVRVSIRARAVDVRQPTTVTRQPQATRPSRSPHAPSTCSSGASASQPVHAPSLCDNQRPRLNNCERPLHFPSLARTITLKSSTTPVSCSPVSFSVFIIVYTICYFVQHIFGYLDDSAQHQFRLLCIRRQSRLPHTPSTCSSGASTSQSLHAPSTLDNRQAQLDNCDRQDLRGFPTRCRLYPVASTQASSSASMFQDSKSVHAPSTLDTWQARLDNCDRQDLQGFPMHRQRSITDNYDSTIATMTSRLPHAPSTSDNELPQLDSSSRASVSQSVHAPSTLDNRQARLDNRDKACKASQGARCRCSAATTQLPQHTISTPTGHDRDPRHPSSQHTAHKAHHARKPQARKSAATVPCPRGPP